MTEEETKKMLKEITARQPAVILDGAGILSQRQQPPVEPGPSIPAQSWCVCTYCPNMDRDEDKFCCDMAPQYCNSLRPVSLILL